jgi:hypothetical protein
MRIQGAITFLLFAFFATMTFAQDSTPKNGMTFSIGGSSNDISFRRLIGSQWAALGSLGYMNGTVYGSTTGFGSAEISSWLATAGARRYFSSDSLRPFAEAMAGLRWTESLPGCEDMKSPYGSAGGGIEYKVAPRVSIEGSAGLAYTSASQRCVADGVEYKYDNHTWSTFRTALSITFYF